MFGSKSETWSLQIFLKQYAAIEKIKSNSFTNTVMNFSVSIKSAKLLSNILLGHSVTNKHTKRKNMFFYETLCFRVATHGFTFTETGFNFFTFCGYL